MVCQRAWGMAMRRETDRKKEGGKETKRPGCRGCCTLENTEGAKNQSGHHRCSRWCGPERCQRPDKGRRKGYLEFCAAVHRGPKEGKGNNDWYCIIPGSITLLRSSKMNGQEVLIHLFKARQYKFSHTFLLSIEYSLRLLHVVINLNTIFALRAIIIWTFLSFRCPYYRVMKKMNESMIAYMSFKPR